MLQKAIEQNRQRQAQYKKAQRLLNRLRLRFFEYEDHDAAHGTQRGEKCIRLIERCQRILAPLWITRPKGRNSRDEGGRS